MGIEDMMTALYVEEENEPVMKKMQAPAEWEDIAKECQSIWYQQQLDYFTTKAAQGSRSFPYLYT